MFTRQSQAPSPPFLGSPAPSDGRLAGLPRPVRTGEIACPEKVGRWFPGKANGLDSYPWRRAVVPVRAGSGEAKYGSAKDTPDDGKGVPVPGITACLFWQGSRCACGPVLLNSNVGSDYLKIF